METRTQLKSVIFTTDIFAVHLALPAVYNCGVISILSMNEYEASVCFFVTWATSGPWLLQSESYTVTIENRNKKYNIPDGLTLLSI